jgi:hypothetical protein
MPNTTRKWYLGKDCNFAFSGGIANDDVRTVTITQEPGATARMTVRGSGDDELDVVVRTKTKIEVVVGDHTCTHRGTGTVTMVRTPAGPTTDVSGDYQVENISEPQELDDGIFWTISLIRTILPYEEPEGP